MCEVIIPARFNGPPASGNGGYSAGVVAAFIEGTASVRLHSPPPLETPMQVRVSEDCVEMFDGEQLVATARAAQLDMNLLPAPELEQARRASAKFRGFREHIYPTCFVCGPRRPDRDGLELFPGPVQGSDVCACTWQPGVELLDDGGNVLPEYVWSALDCPGCYGALGEREIPVLLGELTLQQYAPVPGNLELVVYSWPLGSEGRKHYGGAAIALPGGEVLAASRSTWIALQQ